MLTHGSLFTGIGGFDEGFDRAGIKTLWQFEVDGYAKRILARRFPNVPMLGNARNDVEVPPVRILSGGFPCTPVSFSGLGLGPTDHRWLWPVFLFWIKKLNPEWIVIENVPGLRSTLGAFGTILDDLAGCGYDAEWDSVSASSFGAPHKRERVWIVAYPSGKFGTDEAGILSEPQSQQESFYSYCDSRSRRLYRAGEGELASIETKLETGYGWWGLEPELGRLVYGVSDRLDRIRVLGNAVVPQISEWIGRRIVAASMP